MADPNSIPLEPTLLGAIEMKIGRINYLGGSDEADKVTNLQPLRVVRRWGEIHTTWGFIFFSTNFILHAHRLHGASNRRAKCSKTRVALQNKLGGLVYTFPFRAKKIEEAPDGKPHSKENRVELENDAICYYRTPIDNQAQAF